MLGLGLMEESNGLGKGGCGESGGSMSAGLGWPVNGNWIEARGGIKELWMDGWI